MYMGEDTPAAPAAPAADPWYARPSEAILNWLGDVTYRTDDYTIRTDSGNLIVDRRTNQDGQPPVVIAPPPISFRRCPGYIPTFGPGWAALFSSPLRGVDL